jgi:hypothetical protein
MSVPTRSMEDGVSCFGLAARSWKLVRVRTRFEFRSSPVSALSLARIPMQIRGRLLFSAAAPLFPQGVIQLHSVQQPASELSIDCQNVLTPLLRLSALVPCSVSRSDGRPSIGGNVDYEIEFHHYRNCKSAKLSEARLANSSLRGSTM